MPDQTHLTSPTRLEPPRRSLDDPGAHELESSDNEEEHFSDALEGRRRSGSNASSNRGDMQPKEDVYGLQKLDPLLATSHTAPAGGEGRGTNFDGGDEAISERPPIPLTVVEKVDPFTPSYGEVPGTLAHDMRTADAEPDVIASVQDPSGEQSRPRSHSTPGDQPIPFTKVSVVDSSPSHGDVPGTMGLDKHKEDAEPDMIEESGSRGKIMRREPLACGAVHERTTPTSMCDSLAWGSSIVWDPWGEASTTEAPGDWDLRHAGDVKDVQADNSEGSDAESGDGFEEFEEGNEADDFGDFDDGFADGSGAGVGDAADVLPVEPSHPSVASFPVINYDDLGGPDEILSSTSKYMNDLFPEDTPTLQPPSDSRSEGDSLFITERSLSLWSQLVTPPPLQPPNWVRSRTRRLFLVSLGVPVDLDEILPASKQHKLVLPSVQLESDQDPSSSVPGSHQDGASASKGGGQNGREPGAKAPQQSSNSRRRKGPLPPSNVDLAGARMLCGTTETALAGFSDEHLEEHVRKMAALSQQASKMLEYWQEVREVALGEKEAFEGVIENLVKHARRVRK